MVFDENTLINILQRIEQRLANVESKVNEISTKTVQNSFQIDVVNIQTLNLKELSYHLDRIDVKELSGMLNIGNTSLGKPDVKYPSQPTSKTSPEEVGNIHENAPEISVKVNGKSVPFTLFNRKSNRPEHSVIHDGQEMSVQGPEIDDAEPNILENKPSLHSIFHFRDIHVGTVEDASALNFGNSFPTNFKSIKKHHQGFGNILGNENDIHHIDSLLEEKDIVEIFHDEQGQKQDEWLEKLLKEPNKDDGEGEDQTEGVQDQGGMAEESSN